MLLRGSGDLILCLTIRKIRWKKALQKGGTLSHVR